MYAVGVLLTEGGSSAGFRINLASDGLVGMLPVFATKDAAIEAYPSSQIIEIETVIKTEEPTNG
jgi:hypothetical protein